MKLNEEWSALDAATMCLCAPPLSLHLLLLHISSSLIFKSLWRLQMSLISIIQIPQSLHMDITEGKKNHLTLQELQHCTKHTRGCTAHRLWSISQLEIKGLPWWKMPVGFERVQVSFSLPVVGIEGERVNGNNSFKRFLMSFLTSWVFVVRGTVAHYDKQQLKTIVNVEKWKTLRYCKVFTCMVILMWVYVIEMHWSKYIIIYTREWINGDGSTIFIS